MSSSTPRNHHYVPRFWQNRFSPNNSVEVWVYDEEQGIVERQVSTRKTMSLDDLNTIWNGSTIDVSAETVDFQKIDNDGAATWCRLLDQGDTSETTRDQLADFLVRQVLRVPKCRKLYHSRTWGLLEALANVTPTCPDAATLNAGMAARGFPTDITAVEFASLKTLTSAQWEEAVVSLPSGIGDDDAQAPWTDLFRDPQVLQHIKSALLGQRWSLMTASMDAFALGDTGTVFNQNDIWAGVRVPMSPRNALFLEPCDSGAAPKEIQKVVFDQHRAHALNLEVASWADRWVVASNKELLETSTGQRASRLAMGSK